MGGWTARAVMDGVQAAPSPGGTAAGAALMASVPSKAFTGLAGLMVIALIPGCPSAWAEPRDRGHS